MITARTLGSTSYDARGPWGGAVIAVPGGLRAEGVRAMTTIRLDAVVERLAARWLPPESRSPSLRLLVSEPSERKRKAKPRGKLTLVKGGDDA